MKLEELIVKCKDTTKPYAEWILDHKTSIRVFSSDSPAHLFKWHYDHEDRLIEVINSAGWKFQFDNDLPFLLDKDKYLSIKKGNFHRLIKGDGQLIIKVHKKI